MKRPFVLFISLALSCFIHSFAQLSINPDDPRIPKGFNIKNFDINKINPSDIPSENQLKSMGVTDAEIQQIMEVKKQKLAQQDMTGNNDTLTKEKMAETKDAMEKKLAIPEPKEAQKQKEETKSQQLPSAIIYGQEFFRNNSIRFYEKASEAKTPDNYVLGVGDEINIVVWGFSDYNEVFKINKDGFIQPTQIGRIYLRGLKFVDAKALVTKKYSEVLDLKNSKIDVTLIYSRVITVNIVGEVYNPGSYIIPAVNTAFNALVVSNGPSNIGSVRKIYIKRGGKTVKTLDIYQFLLNPDSNEDFFLEDNDYIFVPPVQKVVKIDGQIRRPHSYELTEKESLADLITYSGGFTAAAYTQAIQIKSFNTNRAVITDINFDSLTINKKKFELHDGDSIFVKTISDVVENFVEISGVVKVPGKYEFKQGEKITDLLRHAQGILDETFLGQAYLIRQHADFTKQYITVNIQEILSNANSSQNIELQKYDELQVFSKKKFIDQDSIGVYGSVRYIGNYYYAEGLTLKDALYLAGGLKREAANNKIEVSRIFDDSGKPFQDSTKRRIIVKITQVGSDLSIDNDAKEFKLQPYDQIFVRKTAQFEHQRNITIEGEVNYPGSYSLITYNEHLVDVIKRAGGLTALAFAEGTKLYRQLDSIGYIAMNLKKALKNPSSGANYVLKTGDVISVPKINELVRIQGAVNYLTIENSAQMNVPFYKGKRAHYYIRKYGLGFTKEADRKNIYVVSAGNTISRTISLGIINIYPKVKQGSTIHVVHKPKEVTEKQKKVPVDWNHIIETTSIKITGLLTIWLLVNNIEKLVK